MWFKALLDLIFPPRCEVCRQPSEQALCPKCFGQVKFMKPGLGIYSAVAYEGVLKEALHRFKFKSRKALAEPLGIILVKYLAQLPSFAWDEIDYLVPVPLHPRRERKRGFNQAELLAQVLSRYWGKPVARALVRVRDTHPQFDLPRAQRFTNVAGAFKVSDARLVYQKGILLLDDIYTTGATMTECSRVLSDAGARLIKIVTLARAGEV
jgi:competence protein ComFC